MMSRPASPELLDEAAALFRAKGAPELPHQLRGAWSETDGLGLGGVVLWPIRRRVEPHFTEGLIEGNAELPEAPGYVYIGSAHDEYLGYHVASGRVDALDFLGDPRELFPDVASLMAVLAAEGG